MFGLDVGEYYGIFLRGDGCIPEMERPYLVVQATRMYIHGERRRKIKRDTYEGILYTKGEHQMLGFFGGQRFDAELETDFGKVNLTFLVDKYSNPNWN